MKNDEKVTKKVIQCYFKTYPKQRENIKRMIEARLETTIFDTSQKKTDITRKNLK